MTTPSPAATSTAADTAPAASPALNERLCHLFRASLKQGRIHPLYLPILKYRHARAGAEAGAGG